MAKPTKPAWATDGLTVIEPSSGKKLVGWQPGEKPPAQYMNWIHYETYQQIIYTESKVESLSPILLRSAGSVSWNGSVLTFGSPIQVSFRHLTGEQINEFAAGSFTFTNGQVVVLKKDKTNPSPVTITTGTYGSLGAAQYAIVNESSLTAVDEENEVVLFRRNGTNLEIPILGQIVATGTTFTLGQISSNSIAASSVTIVDAGNFYTATNVEDALQEIKTFYGTSFTGTGAIVRAISPTLSSPTLTTPIIGNYTNATHSHLNAAGGGTLSASAIASGTFADARIAQTNVTQHQAALSILETQIVDGALLARVAANETITGQWTITANWNVTFNGNPPIADGSLRSQSFVKSWVKFNNAGTILSSYNISAVSKGGTGQFTVTYSRNFSSDNTCVAMASCIYPSPGPITTYAVAVGGPNNFNDGIYITDTGGTFADPGPIAYQASGTLV